MAQLEFGKGWNGDIVKQRASQDFKKIWNGQSYTEKLETQSLND